MLWIKTIDFADGAIRGTLPGMDIDPVALGSRRAPSPRSSPP
jgi:hypothetical protein